MEDRLARLETRVEALAAALVRIEARLATVERGALTGAPPVPAARAESTATTVAREAGASPTLVRVLPLVGRTFLIFGGAWLLRALTDAHTLPAGAGVVAGLVYAVAWLVLADRVARARAVLSAELLGATASVVAFPLVWEATTRLGVFTPAAAFGVLAGLSGFALVVAWRRSLHVLAWIATTFAIGAAFGLMVSAHAMVPGSTFLVGLGVACVWVSYDRHWFVLRWITAFAADLIVLQTVSLVSRPGGPPEGYEALAAPAVELVAVSLLVAYLATFAVRTLARHRDVVAFECVQTVAALLVGFGGAVVVARAAATGLAALGGAALAAAVGCYAVAFAFLERRAGRGRNFVFYTSLALVFAVSGTLLVAAGWARTVVWCVMALTAVTLGGALRRVTLRAHGVAYTLVAAVDAGLLAAAVGAFVTPAEAMAAFRPAAWLVLACAVAVYAGLAALGARGDLVWPSRISTLVAAVLMLIALGSAGVIVLSRLTGSTDAALLATVRTAVLAVAALALAAAGRRFQREELAWLVVPVLVVGGVKLILQDLPQGRPATLVLSFVLYGAALIVAPRLLRR